VIDQTVARKGQLSFDLTPQSPVSYAVYRHVHRHSQKVYVGISKHAMEKRWAQHVRAAMGPNPPRAYFTYAIKHYGAEAFDHDLLETVDSLDEANAAEQFWIAHFGSTDPALGYNLQNGGNLGKLTSTIRGKIGASHKRRYARMTTEQREEFKRRLHAGWKPGAHKARARAANERMTPEQRSERSRRSAYAMTREARSARSKLFWIGMSAEDRSAFVKRQMAHITTAERRDRAIAIRNKRRNAMTTEERATLDARVAARKQRHPLTHEQMSERSRRGRMSLTQEDRGAACRHAAKMRQASLSKEEKRVLAIKRSAGMSTEARQASARRTLAKRTPEEYKKTASKAWVTRRAKFDAMSPEEQAAERAKTWNTRRANDVSRQPSVRINLLRLEVYAAAKKAA
jgi:hypothetical protein